MSERYSYGPSGATWSVRDDMHGPDDDLVCEAPTERAAALVTLALNRYNSWAAWMEQMEARGATLNRIHNRIHAMEEADTKGLFISMHDDIHELEFDEEDLSK